MCRGFFLYQRNQRLVTILDIQITIAILFFFFLSNVRSSGEDFVSLLYICIFFLEIFLLLCQFCICCFDACENRYNDIWEKTSQSEATLEKPLNV